MTNDGEGRKRKQERFLSSARYSLNSFQKSAGYIFRRRFPNFILRICNIVTFLRLSAVLSTLFFVTLFITRRNRKWFQAQSVQTVTTRSLYPITAFPIQWDSLKIKMFNIDICLLVTCFVLCDQTRQFGRRSLTSGDISRKTH